MKNILSAWDGMFTDKQWNAISQMASYAEKNNIKLHDAVTERLLTLQEIKKGAGAAHKPNKYQDKQCIISGCSGRMELYSVCCSDSAMKKQGYFTKWECNKCGKVEYSKQTLNDARKTFMEGKNDAPK
jgi:hypothetical protein